MEIEENKILDVFCCQSCGRLPMQTTEQFGTNKDGSVNREYCCYCYKDGAFTSNYTLDEMIGHNVKFIDEFNKDSKTKYSKEEAIEEMKKYLLTLKRWKTSK